MTVGISISADGTQGDIASFLRHIADEVEAGETRGSFPDGRSWEFDDWSDEDRERARSWDW